MQIGGGIPMRTKQIMSAIVGLSVCYTSSLAEIKYNTNKGNMVDSSLEASWLQNGQVPNSLYEQSLATLSAQGLAKIEIGRVYSAAVMTSLLLKAESALRQAVSQMGMGSVLAVQEPTIQGFRAKVIEDLLKPE